MNQEVEEALAAYVKRSRKRLGDNLRSILLFGSSRRRDKTAEDIDVLTVVNELNHKSYQMETELKLQMLDSSFDFDVTVKSYHDFQVSLKALDPFLMEVIDTGETVYGEDLIREFRPFIEGKKKAGVIEVKEREDEREWRYNIQR